MRYDSHGRKRRRIQARKNKKKAMGWSPVKRKEYAENKMTDFLNIYGKIFD